MPQQQSSFACPQCANDLPMGASDCLLCGIRLTGPDAQRLWEVDQQIASLRVERGRLMAALTAPVGGARAVTVAPVTTTALRAMGSAAPDAPAGAEPTVYARQTAPRKSLSGQQLLLGLGALLLLSAASFFLLVVWLVVGLIGQALIMVTLTGTAVVGSRWATLRGLPAVAETAAVLATGLLLIDLSAAHALGLAGLDAVPWSTYWTGASLAGGLLLLGWDRLIPRQQHGRPLRCISTYRPAAAALIATTPWLLAAAVAPASRWMPAALGLVALANLSCAALAAHLDTATPTAESTAESTAIPTAATRTRRSHGPVSAGILLVAAALALTAHAATGLSLGLDLHAAQAQRYTAFVTLMIVPLLLALLSTRLIHRPTSRVTPAVVAAVPAVATVWAAGALGIPLVDATYPTLVALSVLAAAIATGVHLRRPDPGAPVAAAWTRALTTAVFVSQPVLLALVLVVTHSEHTSLHAAMTFDGIAVAGLAPLTHPSLLWSVLAAAAWALSSAVGAVRGRSAGWAFAAHTGTLIALLAALENSTAAVAWATLLGAFAACTALACVAARRTDAIAAIQLTARTHAGDTETTPPRATGSPFWSGVDRATVFFGSLYAFGALMAGAGTSSGHASAAFIAVGVLTLIYAASPRRLPFAYLGSLAISAGTANLAHEASLTAIEVYTAPLVALLAAIGYVQRTRNPHAPTRLTMGPALAVAFGPSLLTSLEDGDELRLAVVTVAAIGVLLVGLSHHWKAPVTTGALTLAVVALTQGGPLIAYVHGWVILGVAGATLLAAGIAWEKAVIAGRRASAWYSTLT